ncbi:XRE family transcriptional regulator [Allokutzneria sp. A3M-2-11 16]|uniref:helix-turn-helix domain-containing protein n=1 Tax=Allokutzneria sp. A3M-2-11 16 TaxID=2962043 RepID=UPI0020B7D195|nr:XRE family transcriptional regulator [Allokutzneria sp. A3M-2-11 16]MCP3800368.1 XRE family transcriptional regulator [Allokutzneria sp. A3M-2-11 16]
MAAEAWARIGERIRSARVGSQHTQDEVAKKLDIDRSSVVRLEAGQRKISALELAALSELFDVPLTYFLRESPAPVVSRRQRLADDPDAAARTVWRLDVDLESHADDLGFLAELGLIDQLAVSFGCVDADKLATAAREHLGIPHGPLPPLAEVTERFGLYLLVVDRDVDGASMLLDEPVSVGVAVIGGQADPGRRRFTAAHELGHHLLGDAYNSDVGGSHDDREALIDAFARAFLLPESDLRSEWRTVGGDEDEQWRALLRLAGRYRVSWSVAVQRARELGLISPEVARVLRPRCPVRGDFFAELGVAPDEDLKLGATGPAWKRAVLRAYERSLITGNRALELLHGAVSSKNDLPLREVDETP